MNTDPLPNLHTGGVTEVVQVSRDMVDDVVATLMHCKRHSASHVFVVDQSQAPWDDGFVRIGVSEHGLACIQEQVV